MPAKSHRPSWESSLANPAFWAALGCWLIALVAWKIAPPKHVDPRLLASLNETGRTLFFPDYDIPIYLIAGVISVLAAAALDVHLRRKSLSDVTPPSDSTPHRRLRFHLLDIVVPIAIASVVWIPEPSELMEIAAREKFHHLNYYVMGPLLAFRHGAALGTDAYSQYGCGWVLFFSVLGSFFQVDYSFVLIVLTIFGSLYFISVYAALRIFTGDVYWALAGVLCCLYLQLHCGSTVPIWGFPSSTVARAPFDMLLGLALLGVGRTHGLSYSVAAGIFVGLAFLFGTDTGIYAVISLGLVSALILFEFARSRDSRLRAVLATVWGIGAFTAVIGLTIASRGTICQPEFWSGYFEVMSLYPSGFSSLPMSLAIADPYCAVLTLIVLMTYTLTLSKVFSRAMLRQQEPSDLARAFIATNGFGLLLLFINRSHPFNLFHPIVPACVLWSIAAADYFRQVYTEPVHRKLFDKSDVIGICSSLLIAVALGMNTNFWRYPSAIFALIDSKPAPLPQPWQLQATIKSILECRREFEELQKEGSFSMIGEDPTLWLLTLDLPPNGRYCPAMPITHAQEAIILSQIQSQVVVVIPGGLIGGLIIEDLGRKNYDLVKQAPLYSVYRRHSTPESLSR